MTIETWTKEYFVPIGDVEIRVMDDIELTEHCLTKWKGLRRDKRIEHELSLTGWANSLEDKLGNVLQMGGVSCSLCRIHYNAGKCTFCPVRFQRGGVRCDDELSGERLSPWDNWTSNSANPEPMIELLEATLKTLKEEGEDEAQN